jgi:hypothetical protein
MSSKSTTSTSSTKKMGVVRFLQLRPQKSGIAALMKKNYSSEVHTLSEWETILENLLKRKVTK